MRAAGNTDQAAPRGSAGDLILRTLTEIGGETVFHRIRMGPGKAVALVLAKGKAAFCLPGWPPSNEMAFLQVALPGLLHLSGRPPTPFPLKRARLAASMRGDAAWTQFFQARLEESDGRWVVTPLKLNSRLRSQAGANALIGIPEGRDHLEQDEEIEVQVLFG